MMVVEGVYGLSLDINDSDSIRSATKAIAAGLVDTYYTGNKPGGVPGMLPYPPYYWWESGGMFGTLINYWYSTGDDFYNDMVTEGMQHQVGADKNYEPINQTSQLGNDDQCFWALSALMAAEYNFPDPPADQPQWLELAQAVYNRQVDRWDTESCGGGLRWQIHFFNIGWDYKNTVSSGCFFNVASRLAKYTGNTTYADWAAKVFQWQLDIGLMDGESWAVYDGADVKSNCTGRVDYQWSYNVGLQLHGAATMWNITGSELWRERTSGLLNRTALFFRPNDQNTTENIMWEVQCEDIAQLCNNDQKTFKAWLSRTMAATATIAPWTYDYILPRLRDSAQAAATACTDALGKTECGMRWYTGEYDGITGAGQHLCALETIQSLLLLQKKAPVTSTTGGTSKGNVTAGTTSASDPDDLQFFFLDVTTRDRAGAWSLTAVVALFVIGGGIWTIL